jgi:uncharacterized protein with NRDE domain
MDSDGFAASARPIPKGSSINISTRQGSMVFAMCLLLIAVQARADYPLILAANRDEFHRRPTLPLDFWTPERRILAGRDLEAGGTWLGANLDGRLAAVTNYREPGRQMVGAPSRGNLVRDFLEGPLEAEAFIAHLRPEAARYNGFNLILGRPSQLVCFSNRAPQAQHLGPGTHGLSNHLLDTPWPKVARARQALARVIADPAAPSAEALLTLLRDRFTPPDDELPDTGVGLEWERRLASIFIQSPFYGTRCSSVILVAANGTWRFVEQTHEADRPGQRRAFEFRPPFTAAASACARS